MPRKWDPPNRPLHKERSGIYYADAGNGYGVPHLIKSNAGLDAQRNAANAQLEKEMAASKVFLTLRLSRYHGFL